MSDFSISKCHSSISKYIHSTPVLTSSLVNKAANSSLYFKCENFQRAGSYKIRGATNAILQLSKAQKKKGVVTHSSGNFAQALALAAKSINIDAHIVMPKNAPKVKREAVANYNGIITECESNIKAREETATKIRTDIGATFIHPSNNSNVIIGQGTAALELLNLHPELEVIVCPVGGGGLIAGTCLAAQELNTACKIIGAEPFEADDAYRSLISGKIETNITANTIADGLRTNLGDKNFPIIKEHVSKIIRVSENEIINAMKLAWQHMKIIIEPSSAVTVAAILSDNEEFQNKKVGVIFSGGNVDLENLPF